jgi:hypothetical protein
MVSIPSPVIILFVICALIAFASPLSKDKADTNVSIYKSNKPILFFGLYSLPFVLFFILLGQLGVALTATLPYFLVLFVLASLLNFIGLPAGSRSILILVASFIATFLCPGEQLILAIPSMLLSLVAIKFADSICWSNDKSVEDILPAISWMAGVLWVNKAGIADGNIYLGLLLGTISIVIFLRTIQTSVISNDKSYIARIILATTAGLLGLLLINKLLLAPQMAKISYLIGAGVFVHYLLGSLSNNDNQFDKTMNAVKALILIGLLSLVAVRIFGIYGLIVLAPTALILEKATFVQCGGLFYIARILLQVFIIAFNHNVTGINITHAYCNAALYGGFAVILILCLLYEVIQNKKILLSLVAGIGILLPVFANYFLHAEPTGSLMVSLLMSGTMLAIAAPIIKKEYSERYMDLLLMPIMVISVSLLSNGLLDLGEQATINSKLIIIASAVLIVLVSTAFIYWYPRNKIQANLVHEND